MRTSAGQLLEVKIGTNGQEKINHYPKSGQYSFLLNFLNSVSQPALVCNVGRGAAFQEFISKYEALMLKH